MSLSSQVASLATRLATEFNSIRGTISGLTSATQTLTNKRIVKRVQSIADAATITPNVDSFDGGRVAALSQPTTIANPTGTPTAFQQYMLRVKTTAAQTLVHGNAYRGSTDTPLPTTTTGSSKWDYLLYQWNADDSKWDFLSINRGF